MHGKKIQNPERSEFGPVIQSADRICTEQKKKKQLLPMMNQDARNHSGGD